VTEVAEDKDIAPGAKELSRFVDMSVEALVLQNLEIKIMKEQSLAREHRWSCKVSEEKLSCGAELCMYGTIEFQKERVI
jgi:hypothetical protein